MLPLAILVSPFHISSRTTIQYGERITVAYSNIEQQSRPGVALASRLGYATLLIAVGAAHCAQAGPSTASTDSQSATRTKDGKSQKPDELTAIVVTGIRAGIDAAITLKRQSNDIVEAISAEDIGKLPDTNIADSLARLPGLTVQRSGANSSEISIRGFGPDFNGTLLNGRELASTGDNRAVEFDQYPAELISGVVVYKSDDASIVGQGLAGTIDMHTLRPLEYGKRALVLDLRGIENSNANLGGGSDTKQYRASFSYVDQFFDDTLGLTFGFARLDTPVRTAESATFGPWSPNTCPGYPCLSGVPSNVGVTTGNSATAIMGLDKRDGTIATLEWRPSDSFTSTYDVYYTDRRFQNQQSALASLFTYNGYNNPPPVAFTNTNIVDNSLLGATVSNVVPIVLTTADLIHDQIFATGWNNKWAIGGWKLTGDLGYSRAVREENSLLTYGGYQGGGGGVFDTETFNLHSSSTPSFAYNNPYNNPTQVLVGSALFGGGYAAFPRIKDELKSARIDIEHTASGWFSAVQAGVNFDDRSKTKNQMESSLAAINYTAVQLPSNYLLPDVNLGFAGSPSVLNWNVPAVLASFYQPYTPSSTAQSYLVGKSWQVYEKLTTLYVRAALDHTLSAEVTLRGNVGLQVIHTQQSSSADYWNGTLNGGAGGAAPISGGTSYNDVLPSANLVFDLPRQQVIRVGLSRENERPRMDQMADSFQYSLSQSTGVPSAVGGNPNLAPWRADAADISYEKYFASKAYLSTALFYKKLSTYIYQTAENYDFTKLNGTVPPGYLASGLTAQSQGLFTQYVNGQGGRVDGVELTASLPGEFVSHYLSGFGVMASAAETDSSISIPGVVAGISSKGVPLPGLSKTVWQLTLYYEKHGFSARIATRYRSDYVGEIQGFGDARALQYVRHEQLTDFQAGYDFGSGRVNGLSLIFQVNNMTNTPYIDYSGSQNRVLDYQTYGRVYFLGAKYKL